MLADAAAEDDHARLARAAGLLVERADVVHDVEHEPGALERVEVEHVADRAVRERGAVHGDVVLAHTTDVNRGLGCSEGVWGAEGEEGGGGFTLYAQ